MSGANTELSCYNSTIIKIYSYINNFISLLWKKVIYFTQYFMCFILFRLKRNSLLLFFFSYKDNILFNIQIIVLNRFLRVLLFFHCFPFCTFYYFSQSFFYSVFLNFLIILEKVSLNFIYVLKAFIQFWLKNKRKNILTYIHNYIQCLPIYV